MTLYKVEIHLQEIVMLQFLLRAHTMNGKQIITFLFFIFIQILQFLIVGMFMGRGSQTIVHDVTYQPHENFPALAVGGNYTYI